MNALFLQDLAPMTHRALHGRVKGGRAAGRDQYGERVRDEHGARGEVIRGGRETDAGQAAIISCMLSRGRQTSCLRTQPAEFDLSLQSELVVNRPLVDDPTSDHMVVGHAQHEESLP